ncbi:DUF1707 SHOCT-like domain-containing protein [Nocardia asteroides]|uniref:DUF1707 SHOCT-like domain-containing protein n=1 Tax=Nocardia asteroides TaxID=1824 RepID=UPI001E2DADF0|nr:DUF1707 domain-containing protein [Nocardia asteroides]UGT59183.1 DUF1707 domain-containing protein [Nocardia asteroides]
MAQRTDGVRARDGDRVDACSVLDAALADGQLSAAEHSARTAAAMRAKSFGELDALVVDLQVPANLVDAPIVRVDRRSPRRWQAPLAVLAGAAALGLLAGLLSSCGGPGGPDEQVPILTSGAGIAYFLAEYRAEFGETIADEATFYPEYVLVDRVLPGSPQSTADYRYDGGFDRYTASSGREPDEQTLDLAALGVPRLAGLLAGAPRTVGLPDGTISHIIVQRESGARSESPPIVRIYVRGADTRSGYLETTLDGEPLAINKPS